MIISNSGLDRWRNKKNTSNTSRADNLEDLLFQTSRPFYSSPGPISGGL